MINISQNVTKVKQEIRRVLTGTLMLLPFVAGFAAINFAINYGLVTKETVSTFFMVSAGIFLSWSIGGLVETMREQREQRTLRAFQKLGHE